MVQDQKAADYPVLLKVGSQLAALVAKEYAEQGVQDCATLSAALGGLIGESAIFAKMRDIPQEGWINSSRVNDFVYGVQLGLRTSLWRYFENALIEQYDITQSSLPQVAAVVKRVDASVAQKPFPALSVVSGYEPSLSPLLAGPLLRRKVHEGVREFHLSSQDLCYALCEAAILMVGADRMNTPIPISARLTLESMLSATRIAPAAAVQIKAHALA